MKLYEIGNGSSKLAEFIYKNAKPWLDESKKGAYRSYRGLTMRSAPGANADLEHTGLDYSLAFTGPAFKKDRRPLDTSAMRHAAFNGMIAAVGGVANRSNSIFTSGSATQASAYGNVYVAIPLGLFYYTWSPVHRDWTTTFTTDTIRECLHLPQRQATLGMDHWDLSKMQSVPSGVSEAYDEMIKVLSNPSSYDRDKVARYIRADEGWRIATEAQKEIMITGHKVLYVEHRYYERDLWRYLE